MQPGREEGAREGARARETGEIDGVSKGAGCGLLRNAGGADAGGAEAQVRAAARGAAPLVAPAVPHTDAALPWRAQANVEDAGANIQMVVLLMRMGADTKARNQLFQKPLKYACYSLRRRMREINAEDELAEGGERKRRKRKKAKPKKRPKHRGARAD